MLTLEQFLALNLGEVEVIKKDKDVTVKLKKYNLDKYLDVIKYNERIPDGMEWIKKYIILKPLKRHGNDLGRNTSIIPFFKIPIEIKISSTKGEDNGVYRVYSVDPYMLIGNNERFISLNSNSTRLDARFKINIISDIEEKGKEIESLGRYITPSNVDKNKGHYPTLFYSNSPFTNKAHRIVALTWVARPEDDLVINYVVDHIDNDKSNYSIRNLRWVSHRENKIKDNHMSIYNDSKYIVKRLKDGVGFEFNNIRSIAKFLELTKEDYEKLKNSKLPYYISKGGDDFVILSKENVIDITDEFLSNKTEYRYKLVFPNKKSIMLFRTLEEILKRFNLKEYVVTDYYKRKLSDALVDYFKKKNGILSFIGKVKIFNQYSSDKYKIQAKNLTTGGIIEAPSTKKIAERLNVSKSAIITRLNGNKLEGVPLLAKDGSEWLIRKSTEDFPKIREPKTGKRVPIIVIKDNKETIFNSLREAQNTLGIHRSILTNKARLINNRRIIQL